MTESQSSEVLEIELHRLENSCQHLQRSNQELQQAMDLDGPDPDFKQAVEVVRSILAYLALQLCNAGHSVGSLLVLRITSSP